MNGRCDGKPGMHHGADEKGPCCEELPMDEHTDDRTLAVLKQLVKTCNPSTLLLHLADALDEEPRMHEYVDTGKIRDLAHVAERAEER